MINIKQSNHILLTGAICTLIGMIWYLAPNPVVGMVLAFVPLGILFVLSQTFWLVTLFVVFSFFRIHEVFPAIYNFKIPLLLSMGALSALLWHSLISRNLKLYWHPSFLWLVIFWLLVFFGLFAASNVGIAVSQFTATYWKIIVMTLAIAWLVKSEKDLARFSMLIILSGIIVGTVALYNSANGIGLVEGSRVTIGREFGSMLGDPNDLSLVLMFPLAFAISLATTKNVPIIPRLLGIITIVILMLAILATQSRGGLLGSLSVFSVFAWRMIKSKTLFFALGALAAIILYAVAGISDRSSGGAAEEGVDESAMGRIYAWEAAFRMAVENPLTGVGLENFFYNYFYYSSHWDGLNHAVHSTWFGVLAETGFLGLIVFVTSIVSLFRTARRTLDFLGSLPCPPPYIMASALAAFSGLVGTCVSGTFLTQGFNWPINILAAVTIAVSQIANQIEKPIKPKEK